MLLCALLALPVGAQEAAGPTVLPHRVTLVETGDEALDFALADTSRLVRLATEAPVDAFGLIARAEEEPALLRQVLQSEGFWAGQAVVRIAGAAPGTPGLAERLAGGGEVAVEITVTPGPRYRLRDIALRPDGLDSAAPVAALGAAPGLSPESPARAAAVLDAEAALLERLRRAGHPLAAVAERQVVVDHDARAMDVTWTLAPGPFASFARPSVTGETRVNPALTARIAGRLEGQPFDPVALERTRRALLALGVFDLVRARAGQRLDEAGHLPVTFAVTDRPRNAAGVSLAFETNFGPSGRVFYERRNLFGNAELLRLEAEATRIGLGTDEANARISANLRRPGLFDGTTSLVTDVTGLRERLKAYDRDAVVATAILERPFADGWVLQAGPVLDIGRVGRDGDLIPARLAGLVMGARFDSTDSVLDPTRGLRGQATVIPYAALDDNGGFVRAIGTLRFYLDVSGNGGSVVALRGTLGSIIGTDRVIPLDKRFYSGGGGSVRGVDFQSIGPRDSAGRPEGGTSLAEASVELRQRITGPFGVVAFLDIGTVGQRQVPDSAEMRMGAGLGLRYATGIGPLRIDVGLPLQPRSGDAPYGLYVGLGQSF